MTAAIGSCVPSLDSSDSRDSQVFPARGCLNAFGVPWSGPRGQGTRCRRCLRSWHSQGNALSPDFHLCCHRAKATGKCCGESEPEKGSDVRERRSHLSAVALSKLRVKCDTPAKWEQKKHPFTRPSSSPPSFSMETRKRRRSRVCYGKVSPWSETVSGVSAGLELPVSGEGRRQAGRSLATYICIYFFSPLDLSLFQQHVSPPLLPLPLQVDRLK